MSGRLYRILEVRRHRLWAIQFLGLRELTWSEKRQLAALELTFRLRRDRFKGVR
jgi:hypothetical protein